MKRMAFEHVDGDVLLLLNDMDVHLGLFSDLYDVNGLQVGVYPHNTNPLRQVVAWYLSDLTYSWVKRDFSLRDHYEKIVITAGVLSRTPRKTFDRLNGMADDFNILLLDSMHAHSPTLNRTRSKLEWVTADAIHSFDRHDAEEFGFQYYGLDYYSEQPIKQPSSLSYDCYFVGGIKGNREELVFGLSDRLRERGARTLFECTSNTRIDHPGITDLGKLWQPYSRVLDNVAKSSTIVEVLQEGQTQQSVRYFEAIAYNKKLLTNNPGVVNLPYYDSRYMQVFKGVDGVDVDWVLNGPLPDYHYDGRFSPRNNPLFYTQEQWRRRASVQ